MSNLRAYCTCALHAGVKASHRFTRQNATVGGGVEWEECEVWVGGGIPSTPFLTSARTIHPLYDNITSKRLSHLTLYINNYLLGSVSRIVHIIWRIGIVCCYCNVKIQLSNVCLLKLQESVDYIFMIPCK